LREKKAYETVLQPNDVAMCNVVFIVYIYAICPSRFRYKPDATATTAIEATKRAAADLA
jgi:hypothetical protein